MTSKWHPNLWHWINPTHLLTCYSQLLKSTVHTSCQSFQTILLSDFHVLWWQYQETCSSVNCYKIVMKLEIFWWAKQYFLRGVHNFKWFQLVQNNQYCWSSISLFCPVLPQLQLIWLHVTFSFTRKWIMNTADFTFQWSWKTMNLWMQITPWIECRLTLTSRKIKLKFIENLSKSHVE